MKWQSGAKVTSDMGFLDMIYS